MLLDDDFDRPFGEFEPPQWGALRDMCRANSEYFAVHIDLYQDEASLRLRAALTVIIDHMDELRLLYREISKIAPLFDFDVETPGNGYRSFLGLIDKCILHSVSACRELCCQRDSILFRKTYHVKEMEACSQLVVSLCTCLQHLKTLYSWNELSFDGKPSLFPSGDHSPQELLNQAENINQYCFYGRCLGFQYCDSIKRILKTVSVCMASFSEAYYENGSVLGRCANSVKYMVDPEARARRIVNISQRADIFFIKAFWLLNEMDLVQRLPAMVLPSLAINQVISIPMEELQLPTKSGSTVTIPLPSSYLGEKPVSVRLLSAQRRIGMIGAGAVEGKLLGPAEGLIIHCHGGGFVAQSSRSHEVYLREWAVSLDVPILSVDYSLAPEAPYPRALEEVLYAYAWALKHASTLLGSSARKVILIGDSAGANINLAATLRCFELNIRRPDGIFMAYTPVLVEFVPSSARILCLTDSLLPFGFMMRCLKAYASKDKIQREKEDNDGESGKSSETESFAEVSESDLFALALSPNADETNEHKLASLPSDSTLNSVSLAEADATQAILENPKDPVGSQEYIRRFVDMYKNATFGSPAPVSSAANDQGSGSSSGRKPWSLFGWSSRKDTNKDTKQLDTESLRSPSEEFVFSVPRDPLLSPYLAPDTTLVQMPPVKILTTELDPCLDDCVMFARKLKYLGNEVTLDILSGLPHGFLNFTMISKEARDGSKLCIRRIQELLDD